jgi:Bacterial aa3 type cytochrome c oxidase subunit IV
VQIVRECGLRAQWTRVSPIMASNEHSNDSHRSTYESFTSFTKWGTIVIVIVVAALYVFLV